MEKMNKKAKIEWLEILFWIVIIALFIMILTRIFGNSATEVQIFLGFISGFMIIMSFIAKHHREIGIIGVKMDNNFEKVKSSFDKVRDDLLKVKDDMKRIENKIDGLNRPRGRR